MKGNGEAESRTQEDRPRVGYDAPGAVLDYDDAFELLSDSRRRYLLRALREQSEWSLSDLATRIAAWESDLPESEVDEEEVRNAYLSLYHVHVPKLVDSDAVEFDAARDVVSPGERTAQLLAVLDSAGRALDAAEGRAPRTPDAGPG